MSKNKRIYPFRFAPSAVVGLEVLRDRICAVALRYKKKQWTVLKTVKKSIPPSLDESNGIRVGTTITDSQADIDDFIKQLRKLDCFLSLKSKPVNNNESNFSLRKKSLIKRNKEEEYE